MTMFAIWGAILSTILAVIRVWEFFTKDRLRLDTTYVFRGHGELDDEIVIANLSSTPVIVSSWKLVWRPKWHLCKRNAIDVSPDFQDELSHFRVDGKSIYTLKFSGQNKLQWGQDVRSGRRLILELRCFGRKRAVKLNIA